MVASTVNLSLRRPSSADEADLLALDNDPEVMRWINGGVPVDLETFREQILPVYLAHDTTSTFGFWVIDVAGEFAGWVCLRPVDAAVAADEASLGYRIARGFWGKGLATQAAKQLIQQGFEDEALSRIFATTYEENLGSIRVMEKLGMTFQRRFRFDSDQPSDTSISNGDTWPGEDVEYAISR